MSFNTQDLADLKEHGISLAEAQHQIHLLKNPPAPRKLERPCVIADGIRQLSSSEIQRLVQKGRQAAMEGRVSRFVPASGAASRMFKSLSALSSRQQLRLEELAELPEALEFFSGLSEFAFYDDLKNKIGPELARLRQGPGLEKILQVLLGEQGLDYAHLPKALLKFHQREGRSVTALEEQLAEAAQCVADKSGVCRLHFTIGEEHKNTFEKAAHAFHLEGKKFEISFSCQQASTDTLAMDSHEQPFRQSNGRLLFRPGGHGALLKNLEACHGDLVQLKNIDNISSEKLRSENSRWKLALTGLIYELQAQAHALVGRLVTDALDPSALEESRRFLERNFYIKDLPLDSAGLRQLLDRPMRVCGMVKNQGEPGGGPFWVNDAQGQGRAQIVESAETDHADAEQQRLFNSATHFNPVDLLVSLRDYRGQAYNLQRYREDDAVFISEKSLNGQDLRALERPGLWNGSMAGWLTLFVEVPLETFNPVKTVNDLLRPAHQN